MEQHTKVFTDIRLRIELIGLGTGRNCTIGNTTGRPGAGMALETKETRRLCFSTLTCQRIWIPSSLPIPTSLGL